MDPQLEKQSEERSCMWKQPMPFLNMNGESGNMLNNHIVTVNIVTISTF